jgi:hypothetical protein
MATAGQWLSAAPKTQIAAALTGEGARQLAEDAKWTAGGQLGAALVGSMGYGMAVQPMMQWGLRTILGYGSKQNPAAQLSAVGTMNNYARSSARFEREIERRRDDILKQIGGDNPKPVHQVMADEAIAEIYGFSFPDAPKGGARPLPTGWVGQGVRALPFGHKVMADAVEDAAAHVHRAIVMGGTHTVKAGPRNLRAGVEKGDKLFRNIDDFTASERLQRPVSQRAMDEYAGHMRAKYRDVDSHVDDFQQTGTLHLASYMDELQRGGAGTQRVLNEFSELLDDMNLSRANFGQGSNIPWIAHKGIRNFILERLANPSRMSLDEHHLWDNLYKHVFADQMTTLQTSASAMRRLNEANSGVSQGVTRWVEELSALDELVGANTTNTLFDAVYNATSSSPELISRIRAAVKTQRGDNWAVIGKGIVHRMVRESTVNGDFRLDKFLGKWKSMKPEVRKLMFSDIPGLNHMLTQAAEYASRVVKLNVKSTETAKNVIGFGQAAGAVAAVTTNFVNPVMLAVGSLSPWAAAKLMTNESFVRWLMKAQMGWKDKATAATHVANLSSIAEDDPEAAPYVMELLRIIGGMNEINATPEKDEEAFGPANGSFPKPSPAKDGGYADDSDYVEKYYELLRQ